MFIMERYSEGQQVFVIVDIIGEKPSLERVRIVDASPDRNLLVEDSTGIPSPISRYNVLEPDEIEDLTDLRGEQIEPGSSVIDSLRRALREKRTGTTQPAERRQ